MKIYLVMYQECYEGAVVTAAYTTKEAAEADRLRRLDCYYPTHEYTDMDGVRRTYNEPTRFTTTIRVPLYTSDDFYIDEIELQGEIA